MYGCCGLAEELRARCHLDDLPEVHHGNPVAEELHHREVVGDEQAREAHVPLQVAEQVEDRRLHRDVQRRHRLVRDEHLGSRTSARARPTRCRWPPESSCG